MAGKFKKVLKVLGLILVLLYASLCALIYFYQEEAFMFYPIKLGPDHSFQFEGNYEEINIKAKDGVVLNSLLFKADSTKGVIFYLHGNGGSLDNWGRKAPFYTDLGYDLFMIDYRGYGKSNGSINSESQLHEDIQTAYGEVKKRYSENEIVVLGYSFGTGLATQVAEKNNPRLLILQAPFYSAGDSRNYMINNSDHPVFKALKFFPVELLAKYEFKTNELIQSCKMPIVIFHGDADKVIYHGSSLKLQKLFKPEDRLITLEGHDHGSFIANKDYLIELKRILEN